MVAGPDHPEGGQSLHDDSVPRAGAGRSMPDMEAELHRHHKCGCLRRRLGAGHKAGWKILRHVRRHVGWNEERNRNGKPRGSLHNSGEKLRRGKWEVKSASAIYSAAAVISESPRHRSLIAPGGV